MAHECVGAGLTTILSSLTQMRLNPPRRRDVATSLYSRIPYSLKHDK
ncbi:hypothetical protein MC7420_1765 [Coleofasciculus chthonoplastes PCC 7420]|uniref:Uncharacterized protein n=1 Tax=Coleofasciculus chthonoplastes PCC 7420 TaxID=118168 RepID=B4VML0_9CYAN|nr:hypothetical protein MC7420_1765 [Coleofasciculus chthonoplastes PCC 7420]